MRRAKSNVLLLLVIVTLFWVVAFVSWWTSVWYTDAFAQLGADLPTASFFVLKVSGNLIVPFGIGAIFTTVILYEFFRKTNRAILRSVWLLCISTALSLVVMVAITLPMLKMCGEFLPERPNTFESTGIENKRNAVLHLAESKIAFGVSETHLR